MKFWRTIGRGIVSLRKATAGECRGRGRLVVVAIVVALAEEKSRVVVKVLRIHEF